MTLIEKYPEFDDREHNIGTLYHQDFIEEILDKHFVRKTQAVPISQFMERDKVTVIDRLFISEEKVKDTIDSMWFPSGISEDNLRLIRKSIKNKLGLEE